MPIQSKGLRVETSPPYRRHTAATSLTRERVDVVTLDRYRSPTLQGVCGNTLLERGGEQAHR